MIRVRTRNEHDLKRLLLVALVTLLVACDGSSSQGPYGEVPLSNVSPNGSSSVNNNVLSLIGTLPFEELSDAEQAAVVFMREEEKLARDVYSYLYGAWNMTIFTNIADSEQTHTDAVLRLIQKYNLADPAEGRPEGEFSNATLQGLYDLLVAQGTASLIDALVVGATIEDLDIFDLHRELAIIDNQDVAVVFESLQKGSRNHLRAFYGQLDNMNFVYTPVYISQQEYDEVVNSPMERGQ